jgi:hypothetical protein
VAHQYLVLLDLRNYYYPMLLRASYTTTRYTQAIYDYDLRISAAIEVEWQNPDTFRMQTRRFPPKEPPTQRMPRGQPPRILYRDVIQKYKRNGVMILLKILLGMDTHRRYYSSFRLRPRQPRAKCPNNREILSSRGKRQCIRRMAANVSPRLEH